MDHYSKVMDTSLPMFYFFQFVISETHIHVNRNRGSLLFLNLSLMILLHCCSWMTTQNVVIVLIVLFLRFVWNYSLLFGGALKTRNQYLVHPIVNPLTVFVGIRLLQFLLCNTDNILSHLNRSSIISLVVGFILLCHH